MEGSSIIFTPPRWRGFIFQLGMLVLLLALVIFLFYQALAAELGPLFLLFMLIKSFVSVFF